MSGGANKQFLANPTNFLRNNILIVNISNNQNLGAYPVPPAGGQCGVTVSVNISTVPDDKGSRDGGGRVPVYKVDVAAGVANAYSHRFNAYYLPYRNNNFATMDLNNGADIFFTDTMNGCCFGKSNTIDPKVAHLNYTEGKIDGSAIDQAAIDEQFTRIFGGGGTKFKRDDYKVGVADYVTLVGVRQHGQWQFMWQRRERHGLGATKMGLGWKLHKDMPVTL